MDTAVQRVETMRHGLRTVPRRILAEVLQQHPEIKGAHLALQIWMERAPQKIDPDYGLSALPYQIVASLLGRKHANTGAFLEEHKKMVPGFSYRKHNHEEKKCRLILETGTVSLFEDDFLHLYDRNDLVSLQRKRPISEKMKREQWKKMQKELAQVRTMHEDQRLIMDYLHRRKTTLYSEPLQKNWDRAICFAEEKEEAVWYQQMLFDLRDLWIPYYFPSQQQPCMTYRIFGRGIPQLPTALRHLLFPDWIDIDIQCCFLRLVLVYRDIPEIRSFLETKQSLWIFLGEQMGIEKKDWNKAFAYLKPAFYSLFFGKSVKQIDKELRLFFRSEGIGFQQTFSNLPFIVLVKEVLDDIKQQIQQEGGVKGAYGWIAKKQGTPDQVLACAFQSYELFLLRPCYELASKLEEAKNPDFQIVLHQHDGLSILVKPGKNPETIFKRLQKAVEEQGKHLGISIVLVWKKKQGPSITPSLYIVTPDSGLRPAVRRWEVEI